MSSTVQEVLQCAAATDPPFYSEGNTGEQQAVVAELDFLGFDSPLPQSGPSLSTWRGIPDFNRFRDRIPNSGGFAA